MASFWSGSKRDRLLRAGVEARGIGDPVALRQGHPSAAGRVKIQEVPKPVPPSNAIDEATEPLEEGDSDAVHAPITEISFDEETVLQSPYEPGSFFADRFHLEASLGRGAMGMVFAATDTTNDEMVALKILAKERHDAEARSRFVREAEILRELEHPGIVTLRDAGHTEGVPWFSMELVQGETLGGRIRRKGKIELEEVAMLLSAVADALQTAHGQGVIHRDLKPDHILIVKDRKSKAPVRLIDFGLSQAASLKRLTRTGTLIGTPRYMAPEIIRSVQNTSPASDIYALGVILFEALAGTSPFAASDQGQLLGAIMNGNTRDLAEERPDLPQDLCDVVKKALHPDPEKRFADPTKLAIEFGVAAGVRLSAPPRFLVPSQVDIFVPKIASRKTTRRKWVERLGLSALVIASAVLSYVVVRAIRGM